MTMEERQTNPNLMSPLWPMVVAAKNAAAIHHSLSAAMDMTLGLSRYVGAFSRPYWRSVGFFSERERQRLFTANPLDTFADYARLGGMNLDMYLKATLGFARLLNQFGELEREKAVTALVNTLTGAEGEDLEGYLARQAAVARMISTGYPEAMEAVEAEFGFHFERYGYGSTAETDRFLLWRVKPTDPEVKPDDRRKPMIIVPPYVLGSNILAFLPDEDRSYAHAFANQGIPTYIRVQKDIQEHEAVQVMTGEDDARDTRYFCERVMAIHGAPVTLNGYCQGGYSSLCNLLSGELDGLVDALITCVSPMDGTKSKGLKSFLDELPPVFNNLDYGVKRLPSGQEAADGLLMGWIYKIKSIDAENPLSALARDTLLFASQQSSEMKLNKSAVAINYWLANERTDIPLAITRMSFASYNRPISSDGTLPVTLFGRKLQLDRLAFKDIPWLICHGAKDDLVEKECALAPTEHVEAEVTEFPRGHVAIATSWSHPQSACALHTRFGEGGRYRGPARWHLDLEQERREREG